MSRRPRHFFRTPVAEMPIVAPDVPAMRVTYCDRLVNHNAMFWRCACGASGRVRVSADGIPAGPDSFRHLPGGDPC